MLQKRKNVQRPQSSSTNQPRLPSTLGFVNEDAPEVFIRGGATRENLAGSAPPLSGEPTRQRALAGSCADHRLANIGHFEPFRQLRFGEQTVNSKFIHDQYGTPDLQRYEERVQENLVRLEKLNEKEKLEPNSKEEISEGAFRKLILDELHKGETYMVDEQTNLKRDYKVELKQEFKEPLILGQSKPGYMPPRITIYGSNVAYAPYGWIDGLQRTFIQMRTKLKVVDNSGAKEIMCIQALKAGKKGARLGDLIVASVKEFQTPGRAKKGDMKVKESQPAGKGKKGELKKNELKKGSVVYAVVVRAAMQRGRCDGSEVKFDDNAAVLVNKQGEPIGTRVFGPIPHELRKKKHVKILSLAEHIV
ncbi:hypothetical protein C3L33_20198, partial [Rhododendron williamsianum]